MDQQLIELLVEKFTADINEVNAADRVLHQAEVIAALTQTMATKIMTIPDTANPANARLIADMIGERLCGVVAKDADAGTDHTEVCYSWNLIAGETREGQVYERLLEKVETARKTLSGKVYDVLGEMFEARALRELLMDAIRYGERPDIKTCLFEAIKSSGRRHGNVMGLQSRPAVSKVNFCVHRHLEAAQSLGRSQRFAAELVALRPDVILVHARGSGTNGRDRHLEHRPGFSI